ncbi:MAG: glycoside hydrolase family 127 protein [Clostridia bacterium]|nr:glycoside hydrolase family 127 protein [Clostridia bacterium]
MNNIYQNNPMNEKRLDTDTHFADYSANYSYRGFIDDAFKFIEDFQLLNPEMWERFVNQFREEDADYEGGWRGEYWGKCMRGAAFVYSYTKNPELYAVMEKTVRDMIASGRISEGGRISSYGIGHEFCHWDIWSRKYVMLGMQYFYEICPDESLREEIVTSMRTQADCIMAKIGPAKEGKKRITKATHHWRGLNSSSLLEPIVRLYTLTRDEKYLEFAEYIVSEGGTDVANIFDLAYNNEFMPYQYPVTKAYEMTSCFEGLLEFYRLTGIERYKTAVINFANRILETDFTVIGCCGCTHELFDHSSVRQANTTNGTVMQETCVTVTLMKFFYQLHMLTGDSKYADAFETSLYNAYLGSINTEKVIEPSLPEEHPDWILEPLPFDSYSPLTAGTRGNKIGGLKVMSDNHYYGCCACIGAAGIGLVTKMQAPTTRDGIAVNLYIDGVIETRLPGGDDIKITIDTEYPRSGDIRITLGLKEAKEFTLRLRNPEWSKSTAVSVGKERVKATSGYTEITKIFEDGEEIFVSLDMRAQAILPIPYGTQILMNEVKWGENYMVSTFDREDPIAHRHIAIRRGPIMLAQENRLGYSVDKPIEVAVGPDGYVDVEVVSGIAPYSAIVEGLVPLTNGKKMAVTDYASAGKLWCDKAKMAVWMLTK